MTSPKNTEHVMNELNSFIMHKYSNSLPNSLLVAQEFILEYPDYGRELGLMGINKIIEEKIKTQLFFQ